MDKKVGKKEILLLLIIFAAAVIGYFVFQKLQSTPGAQVKVTVDGTVYGTYDLYTTGEKAKKIQIKNAEGTVTNTLVIENGKADMRKSACDFIEWGNYCMPAKQSGSGSGRRGRSPV